MAVNDDGRAAVPPRKAASFSASTATAAAVASAASALPARDGGASAAARAGGPAQGTAPSRPCRGSRTAVQARGPVPAPRVTSRDHDDGGGDRGGTAALWKTGSALPSWNRQQQQQQQRQRQGRQQRAGAVPFQAPLPPLANNAPTRGAASRLDDSSDAGAGRDDSFDLVGRGEAGGGAGVGLFGIRASSRDSDPGDVSPAGTPAAAAEAAAAAARVVWPLPLRQSRAPKPLKSSGEGGQLRIQPPLPPLPPPAPVMQQPSHLPAGKIESGGDLPEAEPAAAAAASQGISSWWGKQQQQPQQQQPQQPPQPQRARVASAAVAAAATLDSNISTSTALDSKEASGETAAKATAASATGREIGHVYSPGAARAGSARVVGAEVEIPHPSSTAGATVTAPVGKAAMAAAAAAAAARKAPVCRRSSSSSAAAWSAFSAASWCSSSFSFDGNDAQCGAPAATVRSPESLFEDAFKE